MKYSKSFRYDSDQWPQVHDWVQNLDKEGKDFSEAVRRLIAGQPSGIMAEIENIKNQLALLAEKGVKIEPVYNNSVVEETPSVADEPETNSEIVKVNVNFVKQRYFT
jgi:hypothetical protein